MLVYPIEHLLERLQQLSVFKFMRQIESIEHDIRREW